MDRQEKRYKFSIVIVFKNEEKGLRKTLQCLFAMEYPKKYIEIICVDDVSTDSSVRVVEEFQTILIPLKKSHGISYARNMGIRYASGDIIMLIDAHMYLEDRNTLAYLNSYFQQHIDVDAICGVYRSLLSNDKNYIRDIRRYGVFDKPLKSKDKTSTLNRFILFSSAIGAYRKNLAKTILFPEGFLNSAGEDTYMQIIALNNDYRFMFTSKIAGIHDARISTKTLLRKMLYEVRACGNILLQSSKRTDLQVPYVNYFLSYPLILVIGIALSLFVNMYFIAFCIIGILGELLPLIKNFRVPHYSLRERFLTALYLLLLEMTHVFYIPYYLLKKGIALEQLYVVFKILIGWEIKKVRSLIMFDWI